MEEMKNDYLRPLTDEELKEMEDKLNAFREKVNNETKGKCALITNKFDFIRVTGNPDQFDDLKDFGYNDVYISYETAPGIENYWLIQVDDCLKGEKVVVPTFDYIVKIYEGGLTVVDASDFNIFFKVINENEQI